MKTIIYLALLFMAQSCNSQVKTCECEGFLILDNESISLYPSADSKGNELYAIKNDSINEIYYNFFISESKENLLKVVPTSINDSLKKTGWIRNKYVGIYSKNYNRPLNLYSEANNQSKKRHIIDEYITEPLTIITCSKKWLYVSVMIKSSKYEGWMAPEDQCANVYSTCN
jgi:hypothetical protein